GLRDIQHQPGAFVQQVGIDAGAQQRDAVLHFLAFGLQRSQARPALSELLADPEPRHHAAVALDSVIDEIAEQTGPDAWPDLCPSRLCEPGRYVRGGNKSQSFACRKDKTQKIKISRGREAGRKSLWSSHFERGAAEIARRGADFLFVSQQLFIFGEP